LTKAEEVIAAIKQQGGLVLLPHPFDSHTRIDFLAELADVIEVFNARSSANANQAAFELAEKLDKPTYVASDAHFLSDAALCINQFYIKKETSFEDVLLNAKRTFTQGFSSKKHYFQSQMIKGFKQNNARLILSATKNWLLEHF
jgi:predicted metal-dependent phosphoesterase TrpH